MVLSLFQQQPSNAGLQLSCAILGNVAHGLISQSVALQETQSSGRTICACTYLNGLCNLLLLVCPVNTLAHFLHDHVPAASVDKSPAVQTRSAWNEWANGRMTEEPEE